MTKSVKNFFGTDGIRGRVGEGKLAPEMVTHMARALGCYLAGKNGAKVIIGRDTRESGLWIEQSLTDALTSFGVDVILIGVVPTAGTSWLTARQACDLGIMITASHNPYHDNGIKLFGPDGHKIGDEAQAEIESIIAKKTLTEPADMLQGEVHRADDLKTYYIETLINSLPSDCDLSNLKIVLDCANGAAFETGPEILRRLGVKDLILIGDSPDGQNINRDCGSTHTEKLCKAVKKHKADIGIAMDGDADRVLMCDEAGQVLDGDQIMGALALDWHASGKLAKPALVATVMSNLGLERKLEAEGLSLIRTPVGDRNVAAAMKEGGYNLGGEQSGHILLPEFLPTGDGMLAALQILNLRAQNQKPTSQSLRVFERVPQKLVNIRYSGTSPLEREDVQKFIKAAQDAFSGRILIRASGTEPLIRIMAEGDNAEEIEVTITALGDYLEEIAS